MSMPLYSLFPPTHDDPRQFLADARARSIEEAYRRTPARERVLLPWAMEELVGTVWRSVWRGSQAWVVGMGLYNVHRPQDGYSPVIERRTCQYVYHWNLAVRRQGHMVVENWVRVDHLAPEVALAWFDVELNHLAEDVIHAEQQIIRMYQEQPRDSCWNINLFSMKEDFASPIAEAHRTLAERAAFARCHNLPDTGYWPEAISHKLPRQDDPRVQAGDVQLTLF